MGVRRTLTWISVAQQHLWCAAITSMEQTRAMCDRVNQEERERARLKRLAAKSTAPATPVAEVMEPGAGDDVVGEEDWQSILLSTIGTMKPDAIERLSQRLLREAGFIKVEVRGKSGDGGIDGVGVLRVNLVSFQVYFQCKR